MKAIVVKQPWATLVAIGSKTIETRPWPPNGPMRPEGVRGLPGCSLERGERIAIVAGAQAPKDGDTGVWRVRDERLWSGGTPITIAPLPLGAVVCTVVVDDALPILARDDELTEAWRHHIAPTHRHDLALWGTAHRECGDTYWSVSDIGHQLPLGDFREGRWGWLLGDPQPCDPIPCKGRLGVFELPADVARKVMGVDW